MVTERHYYKKFKVQAVNPVTETKVKQTAKELEIPTGTLVGYIKKAR
ncbi:MAG: hypothetical protein K2K14_09250 [Ruminococcus sp.]|nr:hypothetical protein [Ruminococcus sp.]